MRSPVMVVSDHALALVEELLLQVVQSDVGVLVETSTRVIRSGGKRLRPRLILHCYSALGGVDLAAVVPVAAAVELLHTASLIHDDVNDQSAMRRGQPSVNAELGNSLALLMGDFVFVRFISLLATFDPRVVQILADCCTAIVEGETLQMLHKGDLAMTDQTYLTLISQKTASLTSACSRLGGLLAGGDESQVQALADYGRNLGIAFQIRDDTLDLIGDEGALGKPVAGDLAEGKMSLATIHALRKSPIARSALASGDVDRVQDLLRETGALDHAMAVAREYAHRAKEALELLPVSQASADLGFLADFVVDRYR